MLVGSPNSPDLHIGLLQEKVYKTCMTNLDQVEHHIRTEWAKLDHAIIAAAVHQWRRRLGVRQGRRRSFRALTRDIANLSVCPSVPHSGIRWKRLNMLSVSSLYGSPIILILCLTHICTKFRRGHPLRRR